MPELLKDLLKEQLIEGIQEDNLDMLDEFSAEEIADKVMSIAEKLAMHPVIHTKMIKFGRPNMVYQLKVNNTLMDGYVSLSDDCQTAVSRTRYIPYYADEDGEYTGLLNLAQMINECWYRLKYN